MSRPTLKIGTGNGHNKGNLVALVNRERCDSFGAHEVERLARELARPKWSRTLTAGAGWSVSRGRAKSTNIITRAGLESLGEITLQVSERLGGDLEKFAPERLLVVSCYEHAVARAAGYMGIAHLAIHPDATVRNRRPDHPIVREYREAIRSTARMAQHLKGEGLLPIVSGDLQLPKRDRRAYGPRHVFMEELNMEGVSRNIDWILWDRALRKVRGSVRTHQLYDHKAITLRLRAR